MTVDVVGSKLANSGSGYAMLVTGLGALTGPPMAGWLYDETKDYKNIFYLSGELPWNCRPIEAFSGSSFFKEKSVSLFYSVRSFVFFLSV